MLMGTRMITLLLEVSRVRNVSRVSFSKCRIASIQEEPPAVLSLHAYLRILEFLFL
jgi:hypothetical protein